MKKRVLLIVLPYLQLSERNAPSTKMHSLAVIPYGVLSVATYCKDTAIIEIIDCNVTENYLHTIESAMSFFDPDIVGFSMTFDNSYLHLKGILDIVRKKPNAIIVIGGAATIPSYKTILNEQEDIDAVCFYEGEKPFRRLLESKDLFLYLVQDSSWVTRYSLEENRVPQKTVIQNIDDIIDLDYSFINLSDYPSEEEFSPFVDTIPDKKKFQIETSRGCPFRCAFCLRSRENDRSMRYASVEKVIARVRYLVENHGMNILTIGDDQFPVNMKRAKEIFRQLEQFHLRVEFMQGGTVAFIDEEMAVLMKKAGVVKVTLPIESGCQEILDMIVDKPVKLDKAKEVIQILRKQGFWITALFVLGFPGETDDHRAETLKWIKEAGLDWSTFGAAIPIWGTKLYNICVEGGYIRPDIKLGEMDFSNYFIETPGYTPEYVTREIYKMNLDCNFVHNYAMKNEDYEGAARLFRQVIGIYPNHAFAWYFLHKCYYFMGKFSESIEALGKYIKIIKSDEKWAVYAQEFGIGND
jgi:radical SAM superfamily enzyme YgiQ (UPF0313 family)